MARDPKNLPAPSLALSVGDPAPAIELLDPESGDGPWRLADRRGATVVLIFHRHIH